MGKRAKLDIIALTLRKDTLFNFALFFLALSLCVWFDGFERIVALLQSYRDWKIDEVVATLLITPFTVTFVAFRALGEAQHELELRQAAEAEVSRMALHDPLTGLPNHRYAEQAIADALGTVAERSFAVLLSTSTATRR